MRYIFILLTLISTNALAIEPYLDPSTQRDMDQIIAAQERGRMEAEMNTLKRSNSDQISDQSYEVVKLRSKVTTLMMQVGTMQMQIDRLEKQAGLK